MRNLPGHANEWLRLARFPQRGHIDENGRKKKQRASKQAKTRIALLSLIRWCALLGDTERKVGKIERDAIVWRCFYERHLQKKTSRMYFIARSST